MPAAWYLLRRTGENGAIPKYFLVRDHHHRSDSLAHPVDSRIPHSSSCSLARMDRFRLLHGAALLRGFAHRRSSRRTHADRRMLQQPPPCRLRRLRSALFSAGSSRYFARLDARAFRRRHSIACSHIVIIHARLRMRAAALALRPNLWSRASRCGSLALFSI